MRKQLALAIRIEVMQNIEQYDICRAIEDVGRIGAAERHIGEPASSRRCIGEGDFPRIEITADKGCPTTMVAQVVGQQAQAAAYVHNRV